MKTATARVMLGPLCQQIDLLVGMNQRDVMACVRIVSPPASHVVDIEQAVGYILQKEWGDRGVSVAGIGFPFGRDFT